jgi:hypothetical protein
MKCLLVVLLLLTSAVCFGAESYSVLAAPARYRFFPGDIRVVCGYAALGCTDITDVALRTTCERRDEGWAPRATILFSPVVHIPSFIGPSATHALLLHELGHIRDFHHAAETYARMLTQRRFESAGDCRAATLEEESLFRARMAYFGKRSEAVRR